MGIKYSKAPISELTFGIFLKQVTLLNKGFLFELLKDLIEEYPLVNTHPVVPIENVSNGISIVSNVDYAKSGFSTYRLTSSEGKYQVVFTQDMMTFHWIRQDEESVGYYPGFTAVYNKFKVIFDKINDLFEKEQLNFSDFVQSYYLCYNDRLDYETYKNKGISIPDIINLPAPSFEFGEKTYRANNYWCRYSMPCDIINGNSLITINTPTTDDSKQILIVENKLKGFGDNMSNWFEIAHDIQVSFFENIFNKSILKSWE